MENLVAILIRPKFIYFSMALVLDTPKAYEKFYLIEKNISITESLLIEENITDGDYISMASSVELLNDLNDDHGNDEHGESLQTYVDFSNYDFSNQVENAMPRTSSNISNKNLNRSDFEIFNLRIDKTETTNNGKTKYTLYNIEVFKFI